MNPRSCKSATCCVPMSNVCPFHCLCQGKIGLFTSKLPKYTRLHLVIPIFFPNLSSQPCSYTFCPIFLSHICFVFR
ncbi:hypothetical protein HanXRQr2_Chr12g0533091 [Helianthus annuus]|uniref:Uncharacterized protein n=1 Tax=Helianthus annuus TaxID=4232 RepID=A0A9K3HF85_HELAN|nr:hypothetical protein HanXRQr2_Chr12g0533091 [Helianthus annuus]KAJ0862033.1 hypothetical protein HanPSC8_Chr12g0513451 [Helianthus annuus]